jgi:hypothetical protein
MLEGNDKERSLLAAREAVAAVGVTPTQTRSQS